MRIRHTVGALAALLSAAVLAPSAAHASPSKIEGNSYVLTTVLGSLTDPDRPLEWDKARQATLNCHPAGGTHPHAAQACDLIDRFGSIANIKLVGPCPRIYNPVTAFADGSETYRETFSNSCVLRTTKGEVFRF